MLSVQVAHPENGYDCIVVVIGNLIDCTANDLRRRLQSVIEQNPVRIFVDLGRLEAMTSIGERLLIDAARMARSHQIAFAVYPGTEALGRRFVENGFDRLVPVLPLRVDAYSQAPQTEGQV